MKGTRLFICLLALWLVCLPVLVACNGTSGAPDGTNARWNGLRKDGTEYTVEGTGTPRAEVPYDYDVTSDPFAAAQMRFAVEVFKETIARNDYDASTLLSPLSISMALSMMANGAEDETLSQMLALFGEDMTADELNEGMKALRMRVLANMELVTHDKRMQPTVNIANSLWLRESEAVSFRDDFVEINERVYGAAVFERAFDESTIREINRWVNEQTDGMIPTVRDSLDEQTELLLINTLFFEGKWSDPFGKNQIQDGTFTAADGTEREVEMLCGSEYHCLDDGRAQGFMKTYAGDKYAFVALLPDAGITVADYVAGLEWETLLSMLRDPYAAEGIWCRYQLPKFEITYNDGGRLDAALQAMGMTEAYSLGRADFSGIGQMSGTGDNIYIDSVIHKTSMNVDENGTRAAAATAINALGSPQPIEIRNVVFDRPFVCMIVECETGIPLFIGTVMDVK